MWNYMSRCLFFPRFAHFILVIYSLLFSLLLAGCVSLRVPVEQSAFKVQTSASRSAQLAKIQSWNIAGAMSVNVNSKVTLMSYTWQQISSHYKITLASSLNLVNAAILGRPGNITFIQDGRHYSAVSPEDLLHARLGWRLPLSALHEWIRDLPAAGPYHAQYDRYGHMIRLSQNGWQVSYGQFISVGALDLPQRLVLAYPRLNIKIVIKYWKVG